MSIRRLCSWVWDTPQLTPELLSDAAAALARPEVDAVLAPTLDGGYWGVGFRRRTPGAFESVTMSTRWTCRENGPGSGSSGPTIHQPPTLRDVDTIEDARGPWPGSRPPPGSPGRLRRWRDERPGHVREGLRGRRGATDAALVRLRDGTVLPLDLDRYLGPADEESDVRVLDGLTGPVLDVGCGPGRHLHALAARGVFALGVDLSTVAVELAVGGGGRAMVGDIFGDVPGGGTWRSALLLDGNIGIGGRPVRLLERVRNLLDERGVLVV